MTLLIHMFLNTKGIGAYCKQIKEVEEKIHFPCFPTTNGNIIIKKVIRNIQANVSKIWNEMCKIAKLFIGKQ